MDIQGRDGWTNLCQIITSGLGDGKSFNEALDSRRKVLRCPKYDKGRLIRRQDIKRAISGSGFSCWRLQELDCDVQEDEEVRRLRWGNFRRIQNKTTTMGVCNVAEEENLRKKICETDAHQTFDKDGSSMEEACRSMCPLLSPSSNRNRF
eukprot:GHVN01095001.1.p2 GENE.GHVN01095001.1~~GHVN01095001.1.p2  ORF type:complete len:150 (+),score=16.31 GHVN01095001.1:622-1071(+)